MTEHDPLEDLARAWRSVQPVADEDRVDPREQATLAWMQAAWSSVEAPASEAPQVEITPVRRRSLPLRLVAPVLVSAAAAAALLMLPKPTDLTEPETIEGPAPVIVASAPPTVHLHRDGLELRSGRVRLILIQPDLLDLTPIKGDN